MSKKVLAAGVFRDYRFDTAWECWHFLYRLDAQRTTYQLIQKCRCEDGSVLLRVMFRYNGNELIKIFDGQETMFHDEQLAYCQSYYNSDGFICCGKCRWASVCPNAEEDGFFEYCECFDALLEVTGDA